jgi:uncharacterized FlaG/YvyC family protein
MASDSINANVGGMDYSSNYSYLKSTDAKKDAKQDSIAVKPADIVKTNEESKSKKEADGVKNADTTQKASEAKSIYDEQQVVAKKEEERRRREAEEEARAEYLRELSDKLNSKVDTLSKSIKFGVNDKADSIVISVIEQNNEKKVKELSKEDADKLFRRMDYVLGVLFDNKA